MDDWLTQGFLVALFSVFAWFLVGGRLNRQRGYQFFRALTRFFEAELGASSNFKSRLELSVIDPVEPYSRVNLQLMLEDRPVVFLWLFDHFLKGKRDQFVLRAEFDTDPIHELLVADPFSDLGKLSLKHARDKGFSIERTTGANGRILEFAGSDGNRKKMAGHLARHILQKNWPVTVISYHKHRPHLVAVCGMSPESMLSEFFERVRKLGFSVLK